MPLIVDTLTNQDAQLSKAWVNFNGVGVIAIRDAENVGSITDNGVGDYTANFATAMVDANYTANLSGRLNSEVGGLNFGIVVYSNATYLAGSIRVATGTSQNNVAADSPTVLILIHGNT